MGLYRACVSISNGVEQGHVQAPTLLPIFFDSLLHEAKRTCQVAFTPVSEQTAVCSTFSISSNTRKPLSYCLLMSASFSPTKGKPCSTSSTASLMQPRTLASPSVWRRLRYRATPPPPYEKPALLLRSASMAPTSVQRDTLLTRVTSSPMMPQSARTLTTVCPKPEVPLEDFKESMAEPYSLYLSTKVQVYRTVVVATLLYRDLGSLPEAAQATWAVSPKLLALHPWNQTTCQTKKSSREPACPAKNPSCFRCSCDGLVTSQGWKTYACLKKCFWANYKKENAIVVLRKSITNTSCIDSLHSRNQLTVMAAGGLMQGQLALISEKSQP